MTARTMSWAGTSELILSMRRRKTFSGMWPLIGSLRYGLRKHGGAKVPTKSSET